MRRPTDSDDDDNSDELKVIKSIPGNGRTPKGAAAAAATAGGATRGGFSRELRFSVEYKDRTESVTIFDNETIRMLIDFELNFYLFFFDVFDR